VVFAIIYTFIYIRWSLDSCYCSFNFL